MEGEEMDLEAGSVMMEGEAMRAAATLARPPHFVIADRPNPLGGVAIEGPVLNASCCASRYGRAAIPHRHGLTIGELRIRGIG